MKKALLVLAAVLLVAGGVAYMTGIFKINLGANAGLCTVDDEIAPHDRAQIDDAALAFVRTMLGADPTAAYALMTKKARASLSAETLASSIKPFLQVARPPGDVRVAHTYFIQDSGGGPQTRTVCSPLDNYRWTALSIKPGQTQAHVEIAGQSRNNGLAFNLWLMPESGQWHVQYFHLGISSVAGWTPTDLLKRARQERDSGHLFDAAVLYAGVQGTIDRGPAFQLGIQQEFQTDVAKFPMPSELKGRPPFQWTMQGQTFSVAQVSIIGVAGKLGLMFILPQAVWNGNEMADQTNKAFINAFIATHPDYSRDFSFLVARAYKPDKSGGFGTVYQNGKGFG